MGYRSGTYPYRWVVRLNGGATELTRADLNGDGQEEVISYTGVSTQEPYRLQVSTAGGEELWSAELGLAHVGWSSYFLYRDSVKTALLRYEPTIYQGEASYSYELFMLGKNGTTTLAENSVSFSVNSESADSWPAAAQKFADEVNRLLDKSELLFSTLNGELHCYGDGAVIRCTNPSESDGNNLIWQGDDLSTAVYSYWSDIYALNGTKLAALELASGEEISGLAFAPDGVSLIATVSGKSGERKVTITREGSAQQTSLTDWTEGDGAERTYFAPVRIEGNETLLATVGVSYRLEERSDGTSRIAEITGAQGLTLTRYYRGWVSVDEKADVLDAVIADDGKSADVTVQYYASLGGSGYQPYTAVVNIVAP